MAKTKQLFRNFLTFSERNSKEHAREQTAREYLKVVEAKKQNGSCRSCKSFLPKKFMQFYCLFKKKFIEPYNICPHYERDLDNESPADPSKQTKTTSTRKERGETE